jgi:protein SCO1/2
MTSLRCFEPVLAGFLALALAGCQPAQETSQPAEQTPQTAAASQPQQSQADTPTNQVRVFQVKGLIREVKTNGTTAIIKHEEIPGYMMAMTMPFDAKDPKELAGLNPGDQVSFRLNVTSEDGWIDQVEVLERAKPEDTPPEVPGIRFARAVEELEEGDAMPDYPFTNELGRPVRLSEFQGKAIGLTFFYTRCPYPTFCPRQARNFAEVCRRLKAMEDGPDNWHLLSLSFDPGHDTPSILRAYGQQYSYDPSRWNLLTGEMIEIDAITEQFGMIFARDGSEFSHNVRTVVIDAAGRIQTIIVGNEWTADELTEELIKAAKAK